MKLCAVCRRSFAEDDPRLQRQFGGVGKWFACLSCIAEEDERREQKGQRFEKAMEVRKQRIPEATINLPLEEDE